MLLIVYANITVDLNNNHLLENIFLACFQSSSYWQVVYYTFYNLDKHSLLKYLQSSSVNQLGNTRRNDFNSINFQLVCEHFLDHLNYCVCSMQVLTENYYILVLTRIANKDSQ